MFQKIKTNPLYKFTFRLTVIFTISSIVWIFLIRSYYEEQISNKINKEIIIHKDRIVEILKYDPEKFKEELNQIDKSQNVEYLEFYNKHKKLIFTYQKDNSIPEIKSLIKKFGKYSFDTFHDLIPISKEDTYLYHQASVSFENKTLYFKLLVKLDDKTRDLIRKDITETIFVVIITIIIIFISTFPIIYSQYKSMIKKQKELIQSNINTLISLGNAVAKRDSDTSEHNYRVTYYSIKLAQKMNLEDEQIKALIKGSFLHDVGKIAISDNILLKPDKLTEDEFSVMKTHVIHGVDIVKSVPWLVDAQKVILNHHEKVDGSGYPNGLTDKDIPIEAKIFAVADVFDALTSKRPYKEPFSVEKSLDILDESKNSHFDARIIYNFKEICYELHDDISAKNKEQLENLFHETLMPYFYS